MPKDTFGTKPSSSYQFKINAFAHISDSETQLKTTFCIEVEMRMIYSHHIKVMDTNKQDDLKLSQWQALGKGNIMKMNGDHTVVCQSRDVLRCIILKKKKWL